jgi:hypothetical protein
VNLTGDLSAHVFFSTAFKGLKKGESRFVLLLSFYGRFLSISIAGTEKINIVWHQYFE